MNSSPYLTQPRDDFTPLVKDNKITRDNTAVTDVLLDKSELHELKLVNMNESILDNG